MDDHSLSQALRSQDSPFLTTKQAARYLALAPNTLEKMRWRGDGPLFRHHGRYVVYHLSDLDAWSAARACRSTADHEAPDMRQPALRGSVAHRHH